MPSAHRVLAFIDGQNLFNSVKHAWGYSFPNYDVIGLAAGVAALKGWGKPKVHFYTGVPDPTRDPGRAHFWQAKLAAMGRNAEVFTRPLKYRQKTIKCPKCSTESSVFRCPSCGQDSPIDTAEEKGIDVRIALDVIRLALNRSYDIGIIFSQDQDLSEVADEIRAIATEQKRFIKLASAYPQNSGNSRGINGTDWMPFSRSLYDANIDPKDYRKK